MDSVNETYVHIYLDDILKKINKIELRLDAFNELIDRVKRIELMMCTLMHHAGINM